MTPVPLVTVSKSNSRMSLQPKSPIPTTGITTANPSSFPAPRHRVAQPPASVGKAQRMPTAPGQPLRPSPPVQSNQPTVISSPIPMSISVASTSVSVTPKTPPLSATSGFWMMAPETSKEALKSKSPHLCSTTRLPLSASWHRCRPSLSPSCPRSPNPKSSAIPFGSRRSAPPRTITTRSNSATSCRMIQTNPTTRTGEMASPMKSKSNGNSFKPTTIKPMAVPMANSPQHPKR